MKKSITIIGIILGFLLIIYGFSIKIPSNRIDTYSATQYVGGDDYNYIITSSIQGGQISGATISKSIYIVGGIITTLFSAINLFNDKSKKDNSNIPTITNDIVETMK